MSAQYNTAEPMMANSLDISVQSGLDRRGFMLGTLAAGAAVGVLAATGADAQIRQDADASERAVPGESVQTTLGNVRGMREHGVHVFKGVPYAASTAGANRFNPPVQHAGWTGVREAFELGPRCPVPQSTAQAEFVVMDRREPAGEDCLCLNVWSNGLNDGARRPVMVWLHGGGFRGGSAGHKCYDGLQLARKHDVIVVGVNHRINAWGYLYLAGLRDGRFEQASNVGMLDIVASLQWVKDNISAFGGDPGNVTVFGQSGGGGKVSTLLGMPAAKGLFHRAIAMSGSQVRSTERDEATDMAERFLAVFDIPRNDPARILELPYWQIRNAIVANSQFNWGPVMDGSSIPEHIFDPVASSLTSEVPLMIGSMETEVTWTVAQQFDPLDDATLLQQTSALLRRSSADTERVLSVYKRGRPQATNLDIYLILASDVSNFRTDTDIQAERRAALNAAPVYKYYFDWYSPVAGGNLRSMHTMEIPFFFDDVKTAVSLIGDGVELQGMADQISGAVVAFAKNGNPNRNGLPYWAPFDSTSRATMLMNADMRLVSDPYMDERLIRAEVLGL
jgi:para-nitrobenzyl esterase